MIMSNTKYKIRKDLSIEFEGHTLYRIEATRNIDCDIIKGDLGGYIEEENNLSRYDNCWIYDNAKVFDNAFIHHNARIMNDAIVKDYADVGGDVIVKDCAVICNKTALSQNMYISHNLIIKNTYEVLLIGPIRFHDRYITFVKQDDGNIYMRDQYFFGTIQEFYDLIKRYLKCLSIESDINAVNFAKIQFDTIDKIQKEE